MKVKVIKNVLEANEAIAARNRDSFDKHKVFTINLMSSPGAGKTSLILQTIKKLKDKIRIGVIEGDIASRIDANKIKDEAINVVQINTGGGCSLDANMISQTLNRLPLSKINLLFIENVGNLVCPAQFTLGEHRRVIVSSLPEGDDKPVKYPIIFTDADAVVINKMDLLPYLNFDLTAFQKSIKNLNPGVKIFQVSCNTGAGIDDWCSWVLTEFKRGSNKP